MNASVNVTLGDLHRALHQLDLRPAMKAVVRPDVERLQDGLEASGVDHDVALVQDGTDRTKIDIRYPSGKEQIVADELKRRGLADV